MKKIQHPAVLKKSQMILFDQQHHVAYDRTNASGTVSHIQQKGTPHNIGDTVHMGFGTKGGAGIVGKLTKVDGDTAHITNDEGRTFKGPVSKLSAHGDGMLDTVLEGVNTAGERMLEDMDYAEYHPFIQRKLDALNANPSAKAAAAVASDLKMFAEKVAAQPAMTSRGNDPVAPADIYQGKPKQLIADIAKKLNITYGPDRTPLELITQHNYNIVQIIYKEEPVSRGTALSVGGKETMTGQRLRWQKEALAAAAPRILAEVKKHYNVEDEWIDEGGPGFISDDANPPLKKSYSEHLMDVAKRLKSAK